MVERCREIENTYLNISILHTSADMYITKTIFIATISLMIFLSFPFARKVNKQSMKIRKHCQLCSEVIETMSFAILQKCAK